ncbi:MAG: GGDEF domain-containing protein [Solirubrobacteraceae bacterium]
MPRHLEASMARSSQGDSPNGRNNGKAVAGDGRPGDAVVLAAALTADQTLADTDQTVADADQTGSDADQTAADDDQAAANEDQAASDRFLLAGGDVSAHDETRAARDSSAARRHRNAQERVDAAAIRDATAAARDLAAAARDAAAARWDSESSAREKPGSPSDKALKAVLLRAVESRRSAAEDRATAAAGRVRAAKDREQAARDRAQAAQDRAQAARDRAELAHQLAIAETDELTGARARAAGLAELEHEVDRAHRTDKELVVGYVDVVGLKAVNDTSGHAAGDELLRCAVQTIRDHLRSYDLIVRLGGDEFLCVVSDMSPPTVAQRFDAIQVALAEDPNAPRIRIGIGALQPADTAADLIRRADAALPPGSRR